MANFEIDTSGDQGSWRRVQAGLILNVRFAERDYRKTIASCDYVGHGNALLQGHENEIDVADCDGRELWLLKDDGRIYVEERKRGTTQIVTEIRLPIGTRIE